MLERIRRWRDALPALGPRHAGLRALPLLSSGDARRLTGADARRRRFDADGMRAPASAARRAGSSASASSSHSASSRASCQARSPCRASCSLQRVLARRRCRPRATRASRRAPSSPRRASSISRSSFAPACRRAACAARSRAAAPPPRRASAPCGRPARRRRRRRRAAARGVAREHPVAVVVEVAVERRDRAVGDQPQLVGGRAQQVAVVRDDDQRAVVVLQRLGQRLAHLDVEVVGRLVEQQQVGLLPHEQRQREPRLLAAGEAADRLRRHVAAKIEAAEEVAQLLLARRRVEPCARCHSGDSSARSCSTWCCAK